MPSRLTFLSHTHLFSSYFFCIAVYLRAPIPKSASKSASSTKNRIAARNPSLSARTPMTCGVRIPPREPIPVNTDIPSGEFPMRSPVNAVVVGKAPAIPRPRRTRAATAITVLFAKTRINTDTNCSVEITARIFAGGTLFETFAMTILPIMIMIQVTDTITVARLADIKPVLFK